MKVNESKDFPSTDRMRYYNSDNINGYGAVHKLLIKQTAN
jgi:hypothetical protein